MSVKRISDFKNVFGVAKRAERQVNADIVRNEKKAAILIKYRAVAHPDDDLKNLHEKHQKNVNILCAADVDRFNFLKQIVQMERLALLKRRDVEDLQLVIELKQ